MYLKTVILLLSFFSELNTLRSFSRRLSSSISSAATILVLCLSIKAHTSKLVSRLIHSDPLHLLHAISFPRHPPPTINHSSLCTPYSFLLPSFVYFILSVQMPFTLLMSGKLKFLFQDRTHTLLLWSLVGSLFPALGRTTSCSVHPSAALPRTVAVRVPPQNKRLAQF